MIEMQARNAEGVRHAQMTVGTLPRCFEGDLGDSATILGRERGVALAPGTLGTWVGRSMTRGGGLSPPDLGTPLWRLFLIKLSLSLSLSLGRARDHPVMEIVPNKALSHGDCS